MTDDGYSAFAPGTPPPIDEEGERAQEADWRARDDRRRELVQLTEEMADALLRYQRAFARRLALRDAALYAISEKGWGAPRYDPSTNADWFPGDVPNR